MRSYFGYRSGMVARRSDKIRIHLMIDEKVNSLIDTLSISERRSRSAVVEVAVLEYVERKRRYDQSESRSPKH